MVNLCFSNPTNSPATTAAQRGLSRAGRLSASASGKSLSAFITRPCRKPDLDWSVTAFYVLLFATYNRMLLRTTSLVEAIKSFFK